jgi:RNA ligase (TIGR02306 family)
MYGRSRTLSDWLPQVVKIEKIEKHPNADKLDIATVLGDYPVIIKRDEYKVGDVAAYIPIDSIVPDVEDYYFLCPKLYEKYEVDGEVKQRQIGNKYPIGQVPEKYRIIKAKKILGVYSQGMLVKLPTQFPTCCVCNSSVYFSYEHDNFYCSACKKGQGSNYYYATLHKVLMIGESVVDLLNLKKWEEPEEENVTFKKSRGTNAEKAPQGWAIPYYDIDGLRKYVSCLSENEEIVLTEKLHGSNASFCHDGNKLWCKSRNYYKKQDPDDMWWDVAIRYDLETKLAQYPKLVFFGEIYGTVKGFRYDCIIENGTMNPKVRFFDIWDSTLSRYLNYDDFLAITSKLGLEVTPELYRGPWTNKTEIYSFAEGPSILNPKHIREGFVLKTVMERYEPKLDGRLQFKLIGEGYNLQK